METAWPGPAMEPRPGVPSPAAAAGEAGRPWPPAGAALVFAGCGEREVALAKSFWNSVTLQPPLESRLGPRRASGGGGGGGSFIVAKGDSAASLVAARRSCVGTRKEETGIQEDSEMERVDDQKAQYLHKAKRREEILALLRKQREKRIMKEAVSRPHKPKMKTEESKLKVPESDVEDQESVRDLI